MIDRRPSGQAVLNGRAIPAESASLPWADPAAQWALGVFETLAVSGGSARDVDAHLDRLSAAASRLAIPLPEREELNGAIARVAAGRDEPASWLKTVVSRSGAWAVFAGSADREARGRPVSAIVLEGRRHRLDPTVGIKSIAYAASMLGLEQARARGADDGLWLNDRGHVIGACTANLFVARGRAVATPALSDGARDGVTRARAIDELRAAGLTVREGKIRVVGLRHAAEIFLTSSLLGVRPVVRLDGRSVRGGQPGPIARRLAERLG